MMSVRQRQWKSGNGRKATAWIADYRDHTGRHIKTFRNKTTAVAYHRKHNMSDSKDDALRAVLLFYTVGRWSDEKRAEWKRITGSDDASTKVLCDHIRTVLGRSEGNDHGSATQVVAGRAAIPDSGGADPTM